MKYYILKEKDSDGYLSRTLCRINDEGIFEEYSCNTDSSSGKWIENKRVENLFNEKNENYEIYEPDEKEIEGVKFEIDDAAYENSHTYFEPTITDSKGRKHSVYIYQDYRSVDGYDAETRFEYDEIMDREDYDYYYDERINTLARRNKDTGKYELLSLDEKKNKVWVDEEGFGATLEEIGYENFELVGDFNEVLEIINDFYFE